MKTKPKKYKSIQIDIYSLSENEFFRILSAKLFTSVTYRTKILEVSSLETMVVKHIHQMIYLLSDVIQSLACSFSQFASELNDDYFHARWIERLAYV